MSIRVMIADDHPVVREGLRSLIERAPGMEITGEASDGQSLLDLVARQKADVYIVDIIMPVLNGMETTRKLLKTDPDAGVVILSIHNSLNFVGQALAVGAKGYVAKESVGEDIVEAIRTVQKGRCFISPCISGTPQARARLKKYMKVCGSGKKPLLTARQRQILQLLAEGMTSKEVSSKLHLSLHTVHIHRNNIMCRLDIHTQTELVRYAIKEGIAKL